MQYADEMLKGPAPSSPQKIKKEKRKNPKKDKSARRKCAADRPDVAQFAPSVNAVCKKCKLRPRANGSSRCQKCSDEFNRV